MKLNMGDVHKNLTERIKEYISVIIEEYGKFIPKERLDYLKSIKDYNEILRIYDYKEVSAYANERNISMPLCADRLLNMISKVPGYGINKNHKTYSDDIVINDNTYLTYLKHVFISGTDAEGYYEDILLHEVMHFCGSTGAKVLEEGTNELLTRMLAQKYNLRTSSCGYPKEVKLVNELMECFGEETIKRLAFMRHMEDRIDYLRNKLGEDAANLYLKVHEQAEKEFADKYYSHMSEFKGATGLAKKVLFYDKIDYSKVYSLIDEYKSGIGENTIHRR